MSTGPGARRSRRLVVVGSGIAGLYGAIAAAERGHTALLLTKDRLQDSNTWYAQGGISAVGPAGVASGDSAAAHVEDTLRAGARLGDARAVRMMCTSAWGHIEALAAHGTAFDPAVPSGRASGTTPGPRPGADGTGAWALGLEAAHSAPRILHAGGDSTGRVVAAALIGVVRRLAAEGRIELREHTLAAGLQVAEGAVDGVRLADGTVERGDAVLLATGGIGRLYPLTTNPAGATGDGAAMAWAAGAALADAEFVQFHPTLVPDGPFMVSEAVRGEGAVLLDGTGRRFMGAVHPDAELAPRDVVARAIHRARRETGSVHLDASGVERTRGRGFLARRFPGITARLAELGHDLAAAPVPVSEAQHYWMGGILTDAQGRSTLPGLFAAGETACTGVHGANRLASNSLLEAMWSSRGTRPPRSTAPRSTTPGGLRSASSRTPASPRRRRSPGPPRPQFPGPGARAGPAARRSAARTSAEHTSAPVSGRPPSTTARRSPSPRCTP
ncbi:L-aspartate oxidase [Zafaria sp. Z1313]|uniref:L-aspartate oxidase n=1 Tax=Zafaria sp. Z1313 TaxID=3423202 RepID=UPI003D302ABC